MLRFGWLDVLGCWPPFVAVVLLLAAQQHSFEHHRPSPPQPHLTSETEQENDLQREVAIHRSEHDYAIAGGSLCCSAPGAAACHAVLCSAVLLTWCAKCVEEECTACLTRRQTAAARPASNATPCWQGCCWCSPRAGSPARVPRASCCACHEACWEPLLQRQLPLGTHPQPQPPTHAHAHDRAGVPALFAPPNSHTRSHSMYAAQTPGDGCCPS